MYSLIFSSSFILGQGGLESILGTHNYFITVKQGESQSVQGRRVISEKTQII